MIAGEDYKLPDHINICRESMAKLLPGNWLNDEVHLKINHSYYFYFFNIFQIDSQLIHSINSTKTRRISENTKKRIFFCLYI